MSRRPPLLHAALGTALLAFPGAVARRAGWSPGDRAGALAVRLLGIRHLGQALALAARRHRGAAMAAAAAAGALAALELTEASDG